MVTFPLTYMIVYAYNEGPEAEFSLSHFHIICRKERRYAFSDKLKDMRMIIITSFRCEVFRNLSLCCTTVECNE